MFVIYTTNFTNNTNYSMRSKICALGFAACLKKGRKKSA